MGLYLVLHIDFRFIFHFMDHLARTPFSSNRGVLSMGCSPRLVRVKILFFFIIVFYVFIFYFLVPGVNLTKKIRTPPQRMSSLSDDSEKDGTHFEDAVQAAQESIKHLQKANALFHDIGLIAPKVYANIYTESNKLNVELEQMIKRIPESAFKAVFTSPLEQTRKTPPFQQPALAEPPSPTHAHLMPRKLDFGVRRKKSDVKRRVRVTFVRADLPDDVTASESDLKSWEGVVLKVRKSKTGTHLIKYEDNTVQWEYMPFLKRHNLVMFL